MDNQQRNKLQIKRPELYPDVKVNSLGEVLHRTTLKPYKQRTNRDGYKVVNLSVREGRVYMTVHRAVASAFHPNPDNLPCVNHKDGDKTNNVPENLEWVTHSQNSRHAVTNGLMKGRKGIEHPLAKLREDQVEHVCRLILEGHSQKAIQGITGVGSGMVSEIKTKKKWSHISDKFFKEDPSHKKMSSRLSKEDVIFVCKEMLKGKSNTEIGKMVDRSHKLISDIRTGKSYASISSCYLK